MTYVKGLARTLPCLMGSPCAGTFHPSSSMDLQPPGRPAPPLQAHAPSPGHPHSCQAVSSRKEKGTAAAVPTSFPASSWLSAGAHERGLPPSGLGNMPSRRFLRRCRGHHPSLPDANPSLPPLRAHVCSWQSSSSVPRDLQKMQLTPLYLNPPRLPLTPKGKACVPECALCCPHTPASALAAPTKASGMSLTFPLQNLHLGPVLFTPTPSLLWLWGTGWFWPPICLPGIQHVTALGKPSWIPRPDEVPHHTSIVCFLPMSSGSSRAVPDGSRWARWARAGAGSS